MCSLYRNYKKQGQDEENKDEHNEDNKPVEVTHGKDNTDKSVEELTQGEDVPQVRTTVVLLHQSCLLFRLACFGLSARVW